MVACGGMDFIIVQPLLWIDSARQPLLVPPPPLPGIASREGSIVKSVYEGFVDKAVEDCLSRCRDDLTALTRFVTWDLHERSAGALRRSLPDSSMVQVYSLAVGPRGLCLSVPLWLLGRSSFLRSCVPWVRLLRLGNPSCRLVRGLCSADVGRRFRRCHALLFVCPVGRAGWIRCWRAGSVVSSPLPWIRLLSLGDPSCLLSCARAYARPRTVGLFVAPCGGLGDEGRRIAFWRV